MAACHLKAEKSVNQPWPGHFGAIPSHLFPLLWYVLIVLCLAFRLEHIYRAAVQSVPHTHVSDMNFLPNIAREYTGIFVKY